MLKIKTTKLQEMLSRAVKGASCNKLVPMTSLLTMELQGGKLTITTTDKTNYLYVTEDVDGDDFYVCVSVEKLPKLIARLTCEDVILDLKEKYLEVKGNGTYQIEFQLDENGEMVRFPRPLDGLHEEKVGSVTLATIKAILSNIRPALATAVSTPQYTKYFAGHLDTGDVIIATDTFKISAMKTKLFDDKSRLISAEIMDLLDTVIDDTIDIYADDDKLIFKSAHSIVYGYAGDGIQHFNANAIAAYLGKGYPSSCKVSKVEILQVLDRISLFVDYLDNDIIGLTFEKDGMLINSRRENGSEKIPYISCENYAECGGIISLDRFRTQLKAQTGDSVDIFFGDAKSIKLVDGDSSFIVALGE